MRKNSINRRDFLKTCLTATAAVGTFSCKGIFSTKAGNPFDANGLPTRVLGKTGLKVPLIVMGCGSRFCTVTDPEQSTEILTYALDNGFYYWDTAHDYVYNNVVSEERLGLVLKDRRDEVFLSTKLGERTYDGGMRQLEESLNRLQTDHLDILQIHLIRSLEDVDAICSENGVLKVLQKAKDEKISRFIGFTGHIDAQAMTEMQSRHDFDTMLIALNHYAERKGDFENHAIPSAAEKGMGVLVMKVIRPKETVEGVSPEELIRYALSLEHVSAAAIGTDSIDVLKKNIDLVRNFQKMSPAEMQKMTAALRPFFQGKRLFWMNPNYTDGIPA
jgi:aryl-alcohol dehydrogenase-like predicted oxidoreductase